VMAVVGIATGLFADGTRARRRQCVLRPSVGAGGLLGDEVRDLDVDALAGAGELVGGLRDGRQLQRVGGGRTPSRTVSTNCSASVDSP